jgi:GTPase KRas protein
MADQFKIVVLGGGSVGKSALTIRLVSDHFLSDYDPTIEDSYRKLVTIDGEGAQLDILDTAGQDDFIAMQDQWMREGKGFLLVYAINSQSSFNDVQTLREKVLRTKNSDNVPIVLVGNKCDLPDNERKISKQEGELLAAKWNVPFFETSAKKKVNNVECFYQVVREIKRTERASSKGKETGSKGGFCTIL